MNLDCYFCAGTGLISSGEVCFCSTGKCKCHNCLIRAQGPQGHNPTHTYNSAQFDYKYEKEHRQRMNEQHESMSHNMKKKQLKPDPATVEAELQLEEQLWAS